MAKLEVSHYTAPSCWASYLINGDSSGISDADVRAADKWLEWVGLGAPVDCEDAGFMRNHSADRWALAADCQRYAFLSEH